MPPKRIGPPRRKAKQERSKQTVEVLLEGAARVLERYEYAAATTNRIAATAGTSVGTLYEYFANKEAVYDALIQREIEVLVTAIEAARIEPAASLHDNLIQALDASMHSMRRGPSFMRSLEHVPGAVFRKRLSAARESVLAFTRQLLEMHRTEIRATDLDQAAFFIVSAAQGIGANASDDQFDDDLVKEIATMLSHYLTCEHVDHS